MKKITYIVLSLLLSAGYSYGQGEIEANHFSRNDLYGTARSISMGGAFGALGGDLTGVAINPAGIAVYRSNEVAGTAVLSNEKFNAGNITNNKTNFNFDNLGFVGYFPTRNESMPVINFGFSYNKVKSFERKIGAYGENRSTSLMDYMSHVSTVFDNGNGVEPTKLEFDDNDDNIDPFQNNVPWLSVLGFNSYLIDDNEDTDGYYYTPLHNEKVNNTLNLTERGSINTYDFTVGTSISNILNIGATLSLADLYYRLDSEYSEDFMAGGTSGFDLRNMLITEGNGVSLKLGLIYRPINEFRVGISYHSPTWYTMTDIYSAEIEDNVKDYISDVDYKSSVTYSGKPRNDYNFKTPDKWTISAAGVLGSSMIVSLDYELMDYKKMEYSEPTGSNNDPQGYIRGPNNDIKNNYKLASSVRAGLEYRFTPQFSGRLGYAWMQNPYDNTFMENGNAITVGSTTAFRMEGDANYITGGFGYRFNRNFSLDFALVFKSQEDDLYSYPTVLNEDKSITKPYIDAESYKLTNNTFKGLLTLGYRF